MTRVNIIDFIARKLKALVGIVQDTDTATVNIAKGKYVIWKGNPCKASSAISSGGTLSASNLTALTEGVGNDINSNLTKIKLERHEFTNIAVAASQGNVFRSSPLTISLDANPTGAAVVTTERSSAGIIGVEIFDRGTNYIRVIVWASESLSSASGYFNVVYYS